MIGVQKYLDQYIKKGWWSRLQFAANTIAAAPNFVQRNHANDGAIYIFIQHIQLECAGAAQTALTDVFGNTLMNFRANADVSGLYQLNYAYEGSTMQINSSNPAINFNVAYYYIRPVQQTKL